MDLATAVGRLEAAGTEQNRKIYRRHGARDPLYGVSFAVLDKVAKEAKRDQALADGLWATGNFDCRLLACKVADPAGHDGGDARRLARGHRRVRRWWTCSWAGSRRRVPGVRERADRWTSSTRDWTAQAGWDLYGQLALDDASLDDGFFLGLLERIEARHRRRRQPDATRDERMNVIAIGVAQRGAPRGSRGGAGRIGVVVGGPRRDRLQDAGRDPVPGEVWDVRRRRRRAAMAGGL